MIGNVLCLERSAHKKTNAKVAVRDKKKTKLKEHRTATRKDDAK